MSSTTATYRSKAKRDYAAAFSAWVSAGSIGAEPSRGTLSAMAAQAVRLAIYTARNPVLKTPARAAPLMHRGASIEQERDGSFSIYFAGEPYATRGGFASQTDAIKAADGARS